VSLRISNYYWLVVSFIYGKVFHEKMSTEAMGFFRNLSYVGLGTFIATIFSFIFNVLSGRFLGPAEYGEFSLVQSVAMFLYIPMLMGSHASMVKYNSEKKEFHRQQKIISTTYILVFAQLFATILLYRLFEPEILRIFSISSTLLNLSIIFAILFVFYTLSTETLRSLHDMKKISILQPVFTIILLVSFLYFLNLNLRSSRSAIYSMYIAYGITSLITLPFIWRFIKLRFEREWFIKLTEYSCYAIMGGISYTLYSNTDKILINRYMQYEDVGIYLAYNYSFMTIILVFIVVFKTVFFPYASMCSNKRLLLKKINKIVKYIILMGFPITIFLGLIILKLYGEEYTYDLKLVLLFSLAGICISIDQLYEQLMNSTGVYGIKIVSFAEILITVVNIVLNILLIPKIGVEGAIIATIISYLILILIILSKIKYIYDFEI